MALEDITTGATIATLNTANPGATDDVAQGDDHIRNIKKALQFTWPNLDTTVSGTANEMALAHKGGTISGALLVKDTLSVSGATSLNTLSVVGATTLQNTLTAQGRAAFKSGVLFEGTVSFSATAVFGSIAHFSDEITVSARGNFLADVGIGGSLSVDANTTLKGTLTVSGAASIASNISVSGRTVLTKLASNPANLANRGQIYVRSASGGTIAELWFANDNSQAVQITQGGEINAEFIGTGKITSAHILDGTIVDADINASADIDGSKILAGSVSQTQIGADAVGRSEVKESTQTVTQASPTAGQSYLFAYTSVGRYGFVPSGWKTPSGGMFMFASDGANGGTTSNSDLGYPTLTIRNDSSGSTMNTVMGYITASPPWDFGDGEIQLFVWLRFLSGQLDQISVSTDAPWNYALYKRFGFDLSNVRTSLSAMRKAIQSRVTKDNPKGLLSVEDKWALRDQCPHPWAHYPLPNETIVLLDPMAPVMQDLTDIHWNADVQVCDLIDRGYVRYDNTDLPRARPRPDIKVCKPRWHLS